LSKWAVKCFAINVSILLSKALPTDTNKLCCTFNPMYQCNDLLANVKVVHATFICAGVIPVYVYDGMAPICEEFNQAKAPKRST